MTNSEKWNKICDIFEKCKFVSETEIQGKWEKIWSEIFGYSNLDGDIDTLRKLQLGSTERLIPDIIIRDQERDLFVVELKQETLPVHSNLNQLFSYLKQLKLDIGILIANKICVIYYDYNKQDSEQARVEIEFEKNNPDGMKFIEFFSKDTFNKEIIKDFITKKNEIIQNVELIKKEISNDLVMELLKAHFVEKYGEEEFNETIKEFVIRVEMKKLAIPSNSGQLVVSKFNMPKKDISTDDKLLRDLRTVGFSTFIKYFEYYNNPRCDTSDIKEILKRNESFAKNSLNTKASTGKGIVKRGLTIQALEVIANANSVNSDIVEKAKKILEKYQES